MQPLLYMHHCHPGHLWVLAAQHYLSDRQTHRVLVHLYIHGVPQDQVRLLVQALEGNHYTRPYLCMYHVRPWFLSLLSGLVHLGDLARHATHMVLVNPEYLSFLSFLCHPGTPFSQRFLCKIKNPFSLLELNLQ